MPPGTWRPSPDLIVLFGAGVGVDAGLPTAPQLIAAIAQALIVDPAWAEEFSILSQPDGPMRFETAMDWLTETADEDLSVLDFLDRASPGPLHRALATAGLCGAHLVTVNFDDLVEIALAEEGGSPLTIDAHEESSGESVGGIPVLKLHGTRRIHSAGTVRQASKPLDATLLEIARLGGGASLPSGGRQRLADVVSGRGLVVVGYSGSDDLDVMPTLETLQPSSVLWIHHEHGTPPREVSLTYQANRGTARLLGEWSSRGIAVTKIAGETRETLLRMGWTLPPPLDPDAIEQRQANWRAAISSWARTAREDDPAGLGWVGLTLGTLGDYVRCRDAIAASTPSPKPDGLWSEQRRLYELAQATYHLPDSEADEVVALAEDSREVAIRVRDPRGAADAELMIARARSGEREYDACREALDRAERFLATEPHVGRRNFGLAYLALWRARISLLSGEHDDAARYAREAAERYGDLGDLSAKSESLQVLGQTLWASDKLEDAVEPLDAAIALARIGPFPDQLDSALQRRAMVAEFSGDIDATYRFGKEAAQIAREHNLYGEIAESLTPWGVAANELGIFDEAKEALTDALTNVNPFENPTWRPQIVMTLADTLFHLGEVNEAVQLLDQERDTLADDPWDTAHAEVIRWRAKCASAEAADAAIKAANDYDGSPYARQAIGILRLRPEGEAAAALREFTLGVLRDSDDPSRLQRLERWMQQAGSPT